MPHSADEMTATFAGPPLAQPARVFAQSMKKFATPVASRNAPKMTNSAMYVEQTPMGVPRIPVVV